MCMSVEWEIPSDVYVCGMGDPFWCVCLWNGRSLLMCMSVEWEIPSGVSVYGNWRSSL